MTPTNRKRLQYAQGYVALGLLDEASDELETIEGDDRLTAEVLAVRADLYMGAKNWELLLAVASELTRQTPHSAQGWIGRAYALRELARIEEAKAVLLQAEPLHGESCSLLHYNLACYECLLGDHEAAKGRLKRACRMERQLKKTALDDSDLQAMWDNIARMQ